MLSNTRTLSPTVVNEFRFGANVIHNANIGELAFKRNVLGELNIPNVPPPVPAARGVPAVTNLGTTSTWGGGADPYTNQDAAFQWVDNHQVDTASDYRDWTGTPRVSPAP